MDQEQIERLARPGAFSHTVSEIRVLETHISWVILTGKFAYKIKKPIDLGFLDFTTLAQREYYCREELRLNRRFAPAMYLDVVSIVDDANGPIVGGPGPLLDYAVKMLEFPSRSLLATVVQSGGLTRARARELGEAIARFHRGLPGVVADRAPDSEKPGTPRAVQLVVERNLAETARLLDRGDDAAEFHEIEQASRLACRTLAGLIRQRMLDGFVRDCHGDLHLENIAILDGKVTPFDCIEFNPAFRLIDIQCEIAFVVMDLEERGLNDRANNVLNAWLEWTGDYAGLALHRFYKTYLALVRCKIHLLRGISEYRRYLKQAHNYLRSPKPFLILMHGVSASGKSTVANSIAERFGAVRIRSDVERKRLHGLAPNADSGALGLTERVYSKPSSGRTFDRLARAAETVLRAELPLVVDATFLDEAHRRPFRELAERLGVGFFVVHCDAPPDVLRDRLKKRQGDPSEATLDVLASQLEELQPFSAVELPSIVSCATENPAALPALLDALTHRIRGDSA